MKRKDIAPIVLVVGISAIFAFIIAGALFGSPKSRQQTAERASAISDQFIIPDQTYFNDKSVNPTQIIRIGGEDNTSPFGSGN